MRNINLRIIGAIAGTSGLAIIGFASGWWIAGGVFLALFGNNLEQRASI